MILLGLRRGVCCVVYGGMYRAGNAWVMYSLNYELLTTLTHLINISVIMFEECYYQHLANESGLGDQVFVPHAKETYSCFNSGF